MCPDWLKSQKCSSEKKKTNGKFFEILEPIYKYFGRNHRLKLIEKLIKGFLEIANVNYQFIRMIIG